MPEEYGEAALPSNPVLSEEAAAAAALPPMSVSPVMGDGPRVQHLLNQAYRNAYARRIEVESKKPLPWGWYAAAIAAGLFIGAAGPAIFTGIANTVAAEATRHTARRLERNRRIGEVADGIV